MLRDLSGAVTEGPGYNVFAYLDGRWLTPGYWASHEDPRYSTPVRYDEPG